LVNKHALLLTPRDQLGIIPGPKREINLGKSPLQVLTVGMDEAPSDKYLEIRTFVSQAPQQTEGAQNLILGILPYNTGVENHQISIRKTSRRLIARRIEVASYSLGFCLIHLAAYCPNKIALHNAIALSSSCQLLHGHQ
jgi:hypothetical protein